MKGGSFARKRQESLAWVWAEVHRGELALHPVELCRTEFNSAVELIFRNIRTQYSPL
jgi:hypothetical protein